MQCFLLCFPPPSPPNPSTRRPCHAHLKNATQRAMLPVVCISCVCKCNASRCVHLVSCHLSQTRCSVTPSCRLPASSLMAGASRCSMADGFHDTRAKSWASELGPGTAQPQRQVTSAEHIKTLGSACAIAATRTAARRPPRASTSNSAGRRSSSSLP